MRPLSRRRKERREAKEKEIKKKGFCFRFFYSLQIYRRFKRYRFNVTPFLFRTTDLWWRWRRRLKRWRRLWRRWRWRLKRWRRLWRRWRWRLKRWRQRRFWRWSVLKLHRSQAARRGGMDRNRRNFEVFRVVYEGWCEAGVCVVPITRNGNCPSRNSENGRSKVMDIVSKRGDIWMEKSYIINSSHLAGDGDNGL